MLHPLTEQEVTTITKARRRRGLYPHLYSSQVGYEFQGNFTVAVLMDAEGLHIGIAKRNPSVDTFNEATGTTLALVRAARNPPLALNGK